MSSMWNAQMIRLIAVSFCDYNKKYAELLTLCFLDGFIAEEYDKCDRSVPKWKLKWCADNLKHMIGKDDV